MEAFNFKKIRDLLFFEVQFSGELRGGTDLESEEFQKLTKELKTEAQSRIVFIDLNKVAFWDTEGMRQILGMVSDLNQKLGKRVYIIAPREGYLFNRAKEKYKLESDLIPWKTSKEGLV